MKRFLVLFALAVAGSAAPDRYRILPGRGFGPFTSKMSPTQLEKLVRPEEFGTNETGVTLYFMDPPKRISVTLDKQKHIRSMEVHGYEGVWHTAEGIGLGTSLTTLEKLNGRPFRFRSLGMSEDAGSIEDWNGGRLARLLPHTRLTFASAMHSKGYGALNEAEHQQVEADGKMLTSSDPLAHKLNPIVETIRLDF
ncbi:hypothetical protein JST97_38425 [bacterium]|nr:hypothetical protein [bacterium]